MANVKSTDHLSAAAQALAPHLAQYMEESERENIDEDRNVVHYGGEPGPDGTLSAPTSPNLQKTHDKTSSQSSAQLSKAMKEMSIDKPQA